MTRGGSSQQRGAVLIVSLVLLVGVTLVSLSSLDIGLLELVMSGNEEARMTAFQNAQAGVDSIIGDESNWDSNFAVNGVAGYSKCTAARAGETCNDTSLSFPDGIDTNKNWARTQRLNPVFGCPPRAFGTSCEIFRVAHFSVDSRYSNIALRGGQSQVLQGFMRLTTRSGEEEVIKGSEITP